MSPNQPEIWDIRVTLDHDDIHQREALLRHVMELQKLCTHVHVEAVDINFEFEDITPFNTPKPSSANQPQHTQQFEEIPTFDGTLKPINPLRPSIKKSK